MKVYNVHVVIVGLEWNIFREKASLIEESSNVLEQF